MAVSAKRFAQCLPRVALNPRQRVSPCLRAPSHAVCPSLSPAAPFGTPAPLTLARLSSRAGMRLAGIPGSPGPPLPVAATGSSLRSYLFVLRHYSDRETSDPEGTLHPPHCEAARSPVQRHGGMCQSLGQGQGMVSNLLLLINDKAASVPRAQRAADFFLERSYGTYRRLCGPYAAHPLCCTFLFFNNLLKL